MTHWLLANTKASVIILQVLPRGDGQQTLKHLCPPRCDKRGNQFTSFLPAVAKVNAAVKEAVLLLQATGVRTGRLAVVDCGAGFLASPTRVNTHLMPDKLHPNAKGMASIIHCLTTAGHL